MDELKDTLVSTKIQHVMLSFPQKSQQIPQLQFDVEKNDLISMEVTPFTTQAVFVDPFPKNLETIFLEEDAVSAEVTKKDKEDKSVWIDTKQSVLVNLGCQKEVSEPVKDAVLDENTSMSAKSTDYAEVSAKPVGTVDIIPNTTAVYDLSGGDVGSPTKTVC